MGNVQGLIIPRSYNDYIPRSDPLAFRNALNGTGLIPAEASAENKLADKNFVNSSVGTNTANYISDDGEPFTSVADLEAYTGTVTNNDYAFVTGTDSDGNTYYDRYKATVSAGVVSWAKEYRLNNSSFTASQWAAITSGITSEKLEEIDDAISSLPTVQNVFDFLFPIGQVVVQRWFEDSPNVKYNNAQLTSTWVEVSEKENGLFERVAGDGAETFNKRVEVVAQNGTTLTLASGHGVTVNSLLVDISTNEQRLVTAISGNEITIESVFTNSVDSVLVVQADTMQGHYHNDEGHSHGMGWIVPVPNTGAFASPQQTVGTGQLNTFTANAKVTEPKTDGTNGEPRTSSETRPKNATIKLWQRTA